MFGDVGGLYDFIALVLAITFGFFADKLMVRELATKLFHVSATSINSTASPKMALASI